MEQTREQVLASMRVAVEEMAAHIADMEAGKTGQGFAYLAPDTYRACILALAKIDGTNGYGTDAQTRTV